MEAIEVELLRELVGLNSGIAASMNPGMTSRRCCMRRVASRSVKRWLSGISVDDHLDHDDVLSLES